jgi:hypothetical protein
MLTHNIEEIYMLFEFWSKMRCIFVVTPKTRVLEKVNKNRIMSLNVPFSPHHIKKPTMLQRIGQVKGSRIQQEIKLTYPLIATFQKEVTVWLLASTKRHAFVSEQFPYHINKIHNLIQ